MRGIGTQLLQFVENNIRTEHHGRVLFIETSSLPHYENTRKFYVKNNYDTHALLKTTTMPTATAWWSFARR